MQIKLTVKFGPMPNFINLHNRFAEGRGSDQVQVPVHRLSDDEVDDYVEAWAEKFRDHVKDKRIDAQGPMR